MSPRTAKPPTNAAATTMIKLNSFASLYVAGPRLARGRRHVGKFIGMPWHACSLKRYTFR